jgi:hypothetical protein
MRHTHRVVTMRSYLRRVLPYIAVVWSLYGTTFGFGMLFVAVYGLPSRLSVSHAFLGGIVCVFTGGVAFPFAVRGR